MATPTDVNYSAGVAPAISAAWLNGISDWVNGAYGVLGATYTALAFRSALGYATGTYTTASLATSASEEADVAHGLGTDNIDFGFTVRGGSATLADQVNLVAGLKDANGQNVWVGNAALLAYTGTPAAGSLRYMLKNSSATSQTITINWWARKRA